MPDDPRTQRDDQPPPTLDDLASQATLPPASTLARALANLGDGAVAVDRDGIVLALNDRLLDLIDQPAGGIRPGINYFEIMLTRARAGAFGSGDPVELARQRLARELSPSSEPDSSIGRRGQINEVHRRDLAEGAWVAIYVDATERERRRREERNSAERQREILEASPAPMTITLVADGQFVAANQGAADLLRTPLSELIGKRTLDFFAAADDRARLIDSLRRRGRIDAEEFMFRRPDGAPFWLSLTCRPISYAGQPAILTSLFDQTERRQAIAELTRRTDMLDAITYAATRFVGGANWRDGIQELLDRLGHAAQVHRVTLFEAHTAPSGELFESCRYDWAAPGLARLSGDPRYANMSLMNASGDGLHEWAKRRMRGEIIQARRSDLGGDLRKIFIEHGTHSFVSVPIMIGDRWWGFLGFDDCERERGWADLEIEVLKSAAALVAAAIERGQIDERLLVSEERYALAARGANDGLWDWDMSGDKAYYSPRLHEILGLRPDELGDSPRALLNRVVPEDRDDVRSYLHGRFLKQRRKFSIESRVTHGAGGICWVAWRGMIVYSDGKPHRVVGSIQDITERKVAEAALREREERLRILTDDAPILLCMINADDRLTFANGRFLKFFGRTLADLTGGKWDWTQDVHPEDLPATSAAYYEAMRDQRSVELENRVRRHDGVYRWVRESHVARFEADGRFAGYVSALVDINDRKLAEAELERQREALHQSEKLTALGSLLAGVAHELNNPLSIVVGQSLMLREAAADPKIAARAEKIRKAAERCARIVRTYLALARQRPREMAAVDLNGIVEMAADLLAYQMQTTDIAFGKALVGEPAMVEGDADQLNQVVTNLLINAQQALADAARPRRLDLSIAVDRDKGRARLTVADNGPGIDRGIRSRIFDPFFTTKPHGVGTGIGLSMCLSIAAAHGGAITVEETPGGGATFVVELPLLAGDMPASARTADGPGMAMGEGLRILVVDDEEEIADMIGEMLRAAGHRVEAVGNGREALDRLAAAAFDLVLSDLRMPVLDGPSLHAELRARYPAMRDRIAFITGDTLSPRLRKFLADTGAPCLEKPFTATEVQALVNRMRPAAGPSPAR
jgi:PAS domain S-box-containing protein